jgi:hypothetical protein
MGAGVGLAPTTSWLMRPDGTSSYPQNWWRLAVSHRAPVVFSHAPSLDRLNLQKLPDFALRRAFYLYGTFTRPACAVLLFIQLKMDTTAGLSPANLGFAGRSLKCSGTS